jgi:hypothetical protein
MFRLQSVGVMSLGRTMAAVHGALSVLFVPIFLIMALVGAFAAPGAQKLSALVFVALALLLPLFYAAMGFLMGALMAVVYNFVAHKLGGIEMHFEPAPLVPGTGLPAPYQPQAFPPSS